MSGAISPVLVLVGRVLQFLEAEVGRGQKVVGDLQNISVRLRTMRAVLQDAERCASCTSEIMKNVVERIQDIAYDMEDVLDEYMIHTPRSFSDKSLIQTTYKFCHDIKHRNHVQEIQAKIEKIGATVSDIQGSPEYQVLHHTLQREDLSHSQPAPHTEGPPQMIEEDEITSIKLHKDNLENMLKENNGRRKTISVVGPCGVGKTFVVGSVYKSKSIIQHFECHAWLSLSPTDSHEQRLQNLLSQLCMGLHSPVGADTASKLRNYLQEKRYIVVLDGVRTKEEWAFIKGTLPDCSNGSVIIIITQNINVATICFTSEAHLLRIDGLNWEESWRLFCKKAYGNDIGKCPSHLIELSQLIVKRCEGLPHPISAMGTHLSTKQGLQGEWSSAHDNILVQMQTNGSNFLPSFNDLPSNQKNCLLYFSLFPEDSSIKREKLIRLWLSEGFVDKSGTERLEKLAEDSLTELISKNLVEVCSTDFRGRVKSCRVQNLTRDFLCQESKRRFFLRLSQISTCTQGMTSNTAACPFR